MNNAKSLHPHEPRFASAQVLNVSTASASRPRATAHSSIAEFGFMPFERIRARAFRSLLALLFVIALLLAFSGIARAQDIEDYDNSNPAAWWIYTGQSYNDVVNTLNAQNARIVDIKVNNTGSNPYTVTYVQNTGTYARQWWWYVGVDAPTLANYLKANNARLISISAYDAGGGNVRFAVAMVANTGADAKAWWYYINTSPSQISSLVAQNKARLTKLGSYTVNGQTYYTCIMIAESGADNKAWWWYTNASPQSISSAISTNKARLIDITSAGNNNFNVVMESCSGGCPAWWWWYGQSPSEVLTLATDNGARVVSADTYPGNCGGSSTCFAVIMNSNTPGDVTACDSKGCISEARLQNNICNSLANKVVGYSCLVGSLRPQFGGFAKTNANAPSLPMTPDLVTNIASVSKTMTATAVLQLLANRNLPITTKIGPYIYPDWSQGQNIGSLTFQQLLTHSTGLGQLPNNACGNDNTYSALETIVANGVPSTNIGKPSYGNCNFALLRELMPALQGQSLTNYPNGPARAQQSSAMYINYVNAHVFQPVGVPASACKPPGGNEVLSYPYPAGNAQGDDWGDWSLTCGSGGWVLSANNIFSVVNSLATNTTLLTSAQKQQMFSDCLGWDCAVRPDCPSPYVCKNGDLTNGAGTNVWTYAGILKCNVPVVVVVNSPLPAPYQPGNDIIGLVENAYNNATVQGTPTPCP